MLLYKRMLRQISIFFLVSMLYLPVRAGVYPSTLDISYERSFSPGKMEVKPGNPFTITLTITNNESENIKGLYISEQIHKDFNLETVSLKINGETISNYISNQGTEDAVYEDHIPHYWIVETGPNFEEDNPLQSGDVFEIIYTVTSQTQGIYPLNQEGVFGLMGTHRSAFFAFDDSDQSLEVTNSTGINDTEPIITAFELVKAYPNPFNSQVMIEFHVEKTRNLTVNILNVEGKIIKTLSKGSFTTGEHSIVWDGLDQYNRSVSSGIYFCQISGDAGFTRVLKLVNTR